MSLLQQLDLKPRGRSELAEDTFEALRAFIYERTGIYFQDNKRYLLESRVGRRLSVLALPDFPSYLRHVQNGGGRAELPLLINAVTINETFFFRNEAQLEALESDIIPEAVARNRARGRSVIRIWSAACSTGDEPYSLALLVKERFGARYPGVRFEIIGTDINTEVVTTARAGVYGPYAVRNVPPTLLSRYFRQEGDQYTLSPEIRSMVSFRTLNLMDRAGMLSLRGCDVILCANVLIYFDPASKQQVVTSLYDSLQDGGYLLVGFSETLYGVTQAFKPVRYAKTIAYKKGE